MSTIPKNFFQNLEFNQKLNFFELKLKKIKEEIAQIEEEYKNKNKSLEPTLNDNNNNNISDTQRKINELEFELSVSKKLNEDYAKEKEEINKKSNDIFIAKNEANKEINEYKNKNKKLKEENEFLTEYFNNKGKEMQNILLNIKQGNNINIKELSQKDEIIKSLMKDKDILYQQIEKLNSDYILLKSIYNKKYNKLKKLVDDI
jgi:chromosome segregation ATPase